MRTVSIKLYNYEELGHIAKSRALAAWRALHPESEASDSDVENILIYYKYEYLYTGQPWEAENE